MVQGFAHGGTNVLWNMLQSHPHIVSPIWELNELFGRRARHPLLAYGVQYCNDVIPFCRQLRSRFVTREIESAVLQTLTHPDNKYKTPTSRYTHDDLNCVSVVMKGVNNWRYHDIASVPLLRSVYQNMCLIVLSFDGYALCNGWMRRGLHPHRIGELYTRYAREMITLEQQFPNKCIRITFSEVVSNPFTLAERLFAWCDITPATLPQLRLKVKRTLGNDGQHTAQQGAEGVKMWFDRASIGSFLDSDIEERQRSLLNTDARRAFTKTGGEGLALLGYSESL